MALGINAGIGNLGVSAVQFMIPLLITGGYFGGPAGEGLALVEPDGGKAVGSLVFIQNAGCVGAPLLLLSTMAAYFGMNNLKVATPQLGDAASEFRKILLLILFGVVAAGTGAYLLTGLKLNMWIVLPVTIILTLLIMKFFSPRQIKGSLERHDRTLHYDLWVLHWLFSIIPQIDPGRFWLFAWRRGQSQRSKSYGMVFSGASGGGFDPSSGRMAFR
jgi:NNP family nitrate/nitrite transporter-like MFS transporter